MSPRIWAVGAITVSLGALGVIAFGNLGENLVYYWSPTELNAQRDKAADATIRLGGLVQVGSIKNEGGALTFTVEEGVDSVLVRTSEIPPAMFREGIGVVVEGSLGSDGVFESRRLMVKHDNEYRAPTDGSAPDMESMFATVEDE